MKKYLLIITALLMAQICFAQADTTKKAREVYNQEFKWRMTIPDGFENIADNQYDQLQKVGNDALQKSTDQKIDLTTKRIVSFKSTLSNLFDSNYQPYDTSTNGDFMANWKATCDIVYNTLKQQMPQGTKLDSTISTETISKLKFQSFKIQATLPNSLQITVQMFVRLFDKNQFTVSMLYADKQKGALMLDAWRNSKFE